MPTQLAPSMQLIHGSAIPVLGFGTSPLQGAEAATAVRTAIEAGYRLIDTAENYHNEDAVGRAIRESGIDRAELFITSKFNRHWHSVAGVQRAYVASLDRLGLDYLDLLLVHWPNPDQDHYVDAVRGLGELLDSGALRALGTSNFKPAHLQRVLDETGIVPDVNQIQLNPYTTRQASRAFHAERHIVTESYSPIGASSDLRSDPVITEVAGNYGKSVAIRTGWQRTSTSSTSSWRTLTWRRSPVWTAARIKPPTRTSSGTSNCSICASSNRRRGYTITRILAGELECSSRCGKRDRRLAS
jgi:2,5-diketo-D-gluconate reductase A